MRKKSMKCEKCQWYTIGAYLHPKSARPVQETMRRLYIKKEGRWLTVGWLCLKCGNVVLDSSFSTK